MADHSKPVLTSTYANFVTELDARFDDLAVGLDPEFSTPTNLPNNSIRWSSASNKWEKWNLTVWSPLSAGYDIDIANGSILNSPISGSTGSFTSLVASGAFSLTGDQVQVSEGGTGATTAATARANLGAAPTASPIFTGTASFGKIAMATMFAGAGGTEGGELWLEKPASGSAIVGNGVVDLSSDSMRFFESGGTYRGAYIHLPSCAGGVGSALWHQGNDGDGSGLDADLLDGQQGSYYAPAANPIFTGVTHTKNTRTSASWGEAQFMAYSNAGSAVDFASTAYHVQDASSAPQWGFNYGDSSRFGLYDSNGTVRVFTLPANGIGSGLLKIVSGDVTIAAAGTDYATPASVPIALGSAPIYACRAWVNFNGTGTPAIRASGNVSSITDNGLGNYTVNFTTAMPDANYAANVNIYGLDGARSFSSTVRYESLLSTSCQVTVGRSDNTGGFVHGDSSIITVSIFR